ncbi:MAG: hypothetical protein A3H01_01540 [Candidatus Wildermuthbacteria bacterium RIFCSPLOWO2_12_FULL_40_9]|uniref:Phage holin family protein n=2 Tax=Candidatus Wildermuthiibacteriota TaxID=1817923 RepID=A0A1G2RCD4_9BACT|nr:MAG: hypothetical protein A3F15_03015 [Candidatus Wildermuthbacteria bacterium RIFCSPHIGHO2_12_FULL_40_12]OHA76779.1 MAG: hypothetical protein A3H01_01540 [Candidatus Wildermuthbacteria bacterium RIFCSPLOWO2_12_FULL_40_9]
MIFKLVIQLAIGVSGLWLAVKFVPNVEFIGPIWPISAELNWNNFSQTLLFAGIFLGVLNFFVKPVLNFISFPLRLITFNLFSFVIIMGLIWAVDLMSPGLTIQGILSLFLTSLIIFTFSAVLTLK